MDISILSLSELKSLQAALPVEIARREKLERVEALKALEALAEERGFKLADLVEGKQSAPAKTRGPVAIKYRHPENAELTWTGRGRKPRWIEDYLANGGTIESLAV